jgi:hypothetical protein
MKIIHFLAVGVLGGLTLVGCGSSSSSTAAGTDVQSLCQQGCDTGAQLKCPGEPANCTSTCVSTFKAIKSACQDAAMTYAKCAAPLPVSQLECDPTDGAQAKSTACSSEKTALMTCLGGSMGSVDGGP